VSCQQSTIITNPVAETEIENKIKTLKYLSTVSLRWC